MAGGGGTPGSAGTIELNVVPLVDVACLLIMFFILTSQFASADFAEMQLAAPKDSLSKQIVAELHGPTKCRLIVNVVCMSNPHDKTDTDPSLSLRAKEYSVQGTIIPVDGDSLDVLSKKIALEMTKARGLKAVEFTVEVRADKRVAFNTVEPVMTAAAMAVGAAHINVKEMPVKMDLSAMIGSN